MSTNPDEDDARDEGGELSDNAVPEVSPVIRGELVENVAPDDSPSYRVTKLDVEGMESKTRRVLAYGAGIVLTAFYTATFVLYSTGVLKDLGSIMAMFSGLQTLTAAAFGFYFAKTTGNK